VRAIASEMSASAPPPPLSPSSAPPPPAELVAAASRANQAHLFDDWDQLIPAQRERRAKEVSHLDFAALAVALAAALGAEEKASSTSSSTTAARNAGCEPWTSVVSLSAAGEGLSENAEQLALWEERGLRTAAEGKLAVVVLAGGQGTRLGSSKPKGCFDIGLPCGTSLFGLHARRVLALRKRAAGKEGKEGEKNEPARVDLFIMTSDATHEETVAHFSENGFFGLGEESVFFFRQGTMPCVTEEGKVIIGPRETGEKASDETSSNDIGGGIASSPDGNGGLYSALVSSGALDRMESRGARFVDVVCVDNALASPGDPAFVGACVSRGAAVGCRAVARERPEEKVGVFARETRKETGGGGRLRVLEYSELDPQQALAVDPETKKPLYAWANVCMHFFSTGFLRSAAEDLGCGPKGRALYHCARKAIPSFSVSENANVSVPGIKLELFIFDAFDAVAEEKVLICGVARDDAFAPVKNADAPSAVDTPAAAREALLARRARLGEERGF
jgi:UDP-N-acetylglucosamine/UDP-N-acetylgalactosamine diphosphorylase